MILFQIRKWVHSLTGMLAGVVVLAMPDLGRHNIC